MELIKNGAAVLYKPTAIVLKRGTATAEAILKLYNSHNVTDPTYKAMAEVGKAEKSIFLCDYLPSPET
jgi:TnpA family transposase